MSDVQRRLGRLLVAVSGLTLILLGCSVDHNTSNVQTTEITDVSPRTTRLSRRSQHPTTTETVSRSRIQEVEAELAWFWSDPDIQSYASAQCHSRSATILVCEVDVPMLGGYGPRLEVILNEDGSLTSNVVGTSLDDYPDPPIAERDDRWDQ